MNVRECLAEQELCTVFRPAIGQQVREIPARPKNRSTFLPVSQSRSGLFSTCRADGWHQCLPPLMARREAWRLRDR